MNRKAPRPRAVSGGGNSSGSGCAVIVAVGTGVILSAPLYLAGHLAATLLR